MTEWKPNKFNDAWNLRIPQPKLWFRVERCLASVDGAVVVGEQHQDTYPQCTRTVFVGCLRGHECMLTQPIPAGEFWHQKYTLFSTCEEAMNACEDYIIGAAKEVMDARKLRIQKQGHGLWVGNQQNQA